MANLTSLTLGELLSSDNPAIKRNATGILKVLQRSKKEGYFNYQCPSCGYRTFWTIKDVADRGEPVCPQCDTDLTMVEVPLSPSIGR